MQALIENVVSVAEFLLRKQGEFYPFATILTVSGELCPLRLPLETEHPTPAFVVASFEQQIMVDLNQGKYGAAALGINISLAGRSDYSDGLQLQLYACTRNQISVSVLILPYSLERSLGSIWLGNYYEGKPTSVIPRFSQGMASYREN